MSSSDQNLEWIRRDSHIEEDDIKMEKTAAPLKQEDNGSTVHVKKKEDPSLTDLFPLDFDPLLIGGFYPKTEE